MRTFIDQLNREVSIARPPQRLVSLVPSQTELLVDLGLEEKLKGITKFCVHPAYLRKEKKVVGGTKRVNLEKIRALEPDLILCNKEENTEGMVRELEKIAPVYVSDVKTIDDALELTLQYGTMLEVEKKASEIVTEIQEELRLFNEFMSDKPYRKVAYFIWKDPWMVVGGDTFIDHLLKLNRLENAYGREDSRYPEINLEDLESKEVEIILLSTEPFPFKEDHKEFLRQISKQVRIEIVDGEFFSWYGSRLRLAFEYFRGIQCSFFSS